MQNYIWHQWAKLSPMAFKSSWKMKKPPSKVFISCLWSVVWFAAHALSLFVKLKLLKCYIVVFLQALGICMAFITASLLPHKAIKTFKCLILCVTTWQLFTDLETKYLIFCANWVIREQILRHSHMLNGWWLLWAYNKY